MNYSYAEEPAKQTPEQVLEPVLAELRANNTAKAFVEMTIIGLPSQSSNQTEELMLKLKNMRQFCGESLGEVELVNIRQVGTRIVRLTYIEHFEKYPMVWRFTMYRGKQWHSVSISFNGEYDELFEKTVQLSQKPENPNR